MDPFVFDQRFSRFLRQVNSGEISKGTELFESGTVRIEALGKSSIRGTVQERREGPFQVSLAVNDEGGFSGSCSCPEFFNCSHSYALARAARLQITGGSEAGKVKTPESEEASQGSELERLWKVARESGNLLYPRDLYKLVADRKGFGPITREPLRDLKRHLQREKPESAEAFGEVVFRYLRGKKLQVADAFTEIADRCASRVALRDTVETKDWDRPPLRLKARLKMDESPDRDWFQVRAVWQVEGADLTEGEIDKLLAAEGRLVNLGSKGWFRLDSRLDETDSRALSSMGLDPSRGNSQRIHLSQVQELLSEELLDPADWRKLSKRAARLDEISPAEVPASLSGILRPYQTQGFAFLSRLSELNLGGILADDMGLGKTLQAISWMVWLKEKNNNQLRGLVVCPKSVTDNWVQEPDRFSSGLSAKRYDPKVGLDSDANLTVVNYTQLRINADVFLDEVWDVVILDEAQYIKSPHSQTSRVAHKLKGTHRLAMTGTPIENSLTDLWSIMRFAMPRLFGPLASFQINYSQSAEVDRWSDLRTRMKPFLLRRLKTEVAKDLPERMEKDIYCELEDAQKELYDREIRAAREQVASARRQGKGTADVLRALLRLRQICCDPRIMNTGQVGSEMSSGKLLALMDLVEPLVAEGHKVLVFSQFVSLLKLVEGELDKQKISWLSLTGRTKNRGELVQRFQEGGTEQVFLLSLKAAGSGLTLTAASYVILLDPWWNPAVEAQAIDRAHRIGQRNQVIAYRILAKDTVEEKIRKIQEEKKELAAALFGEGSLPGKFDWEELESLLEA